MIYLDNASTTNKKPLSVKFSVWKSMIKKYCANPGRSSHQYSLNAGNMVLETRQVINDFFNGVSLQNVVFTSGCTEALNIAILGTAKKDGHIVYTSNEHNSVARPIKFLEEQRIVSSTLVNTRIDGRTYAEDIEKAITDKTYLVVVNHTSNVTGATSDIKAIGDMCKKHGIMFLVDGAQSAGHQKIDMQKQNISMLAVAGHKGLLAGQGIGCLLFKDGIKINPLKFGGTGTDSEKLSPPIKYPDSLEAGTSATPMIFGLKAGVEYVKKHFESLNIKINTLSRMLLDEMLQLPNIVLYTPKDCYNGVVSFRIKNTSPSEVVEFFNSHKICIRGGLHCAPLCHQKLGTLDGGTVRVSISNFNKKWEIKKFVKVLKKFLMVIEK